MRNVNIKILLIFTTVLSLTIAQNGFETNKLSDSEYHPEKHAARNTNEQGQRNDQSKSTGKWYIHQHSNKRGSGLDEPLLTDLTRHKRSVIPDFGYGLRLQTGLNMADRMKRIFTDYGYGSRLQAGENVAHSYDREGLFGITGPGKRSAEVTDFIILNEGLDKDKRVATDYGYGSRLQAAENVAMDWDRNGLFGAMGPGKRDARGYIPNFKTSKRISADFGYGSRAQAAENAAISSSHGGLYGLYGPGKRSIGLFRLQDKPEYEIAKRLTDYGYGSRMKAAENAAQSASGGGLFGVHGPGKRNIQQIDYIRDKLPGLEYHRERILPDFDYGYRELIAD